MAMPWLPHPHSDSAHVRSLYTIVGEWSSHVEVHRVSCVAKVYFTLQSQYYKADFST